MNNYFNSEILECNNFSLEEKIRYGIKDDYLKNILLLLINNIVNENNSLIKENRESQSIIDNLNERNESLKEDILYEFNKNKEYKEHKKEKETGALNIDDIVNKLIFDCNNYNMLEKIKYGIKNEKLRSLFSEMYIEFKADYEDMEEIKFRLKEFEELNKKIKDLKLENKELKEKLNME